MIGYALCGSFCTLSKSVEILIRMRESGRDILPIMSEIAATTDTRFGRARDFVERIEKICGHTLVQTIPDAEPLGPSIPLEALLICPCTGNTLAKIANGITDTPVCMAAKAHLRSDRPLIITLASNDALSANLRNIGTLLSRKNVYFTPLRQDDPISKPHSLVADFDMVQSALEASLEGKQLRPLFL
ncbi:MAG: dipicolinate synthase subunit B [Ruminococcaceae bacterium]|nr:dipicolinate synthase subunit B [Oscillospiraceae bacterium]